MADAANFSTEVMPFAQQLYAHALRMTRNPSDAEDVLQESFLKAYRAYHTFEHGTNLRAWLYRIVTNTYINKYRKTQRRPDEVELDEVEDFFLYRKIRDSNAGASRSAEDEVLEGFVDVEITQAIEALPENFRIPVLLADVEGFSYKEIAEMTDVPIGTVMSRLHRGRKSLQKTLWQVAKDRGLVEGGEDDE